MKRSEYLPARSEDALAYSAHDTAALLGIGLTATYELLRSGDLAGVRVGRKWIVPREGIIRFLKREIAEQ